MRVSSAHIAGVGTAIGTDGPDDGAVVAGTKALLDAGITYSAVDRSFVCFVDNLRISRRSTDAFGREGAPVCETDNQSGLFAALESIQSRQSSCTLVIGIDTMVAMIRKSFVAETPAEHLQLTLLTAMVVGVVLVSDVFLDSHAYLKDAAVCIRGYGFASGVHARTLGGYDAVRTFKVAVNTALRQADLKQNDIQILEIQHNSYQDKLQALKEFEVAPRLSSPPSGAFVGTTGYVGLCVLVWQLRGWSDDTPSRAQNCLQLVLGSDGSASAIVLRRSDGRSALAWSEVENMRDGRERLGYNPASTPIREICREDLEAIKARTEFTLQSSEASQLHLAVKGGDRAALARL